LKRAARFTPSSKPKFNSTLTKQLAQGKEWSFVQLGDEGLNQ